MSSLALPLSAQRLSVQQYLDLEESTGEKWEYFDGEVFRWEAMAGTTPPHALIANRLQTMLTNGTDVAGKCKVYTSDLKLSIRALRRYRYPDVTVICGPLDLDKPKSQAILNPTLLVEVTSKSSFTADYTTKAEQYMRYVPSLLDYLIVVQHEAFVTLQSRATVDSPWETTHRSGLDAEITIPSIGVTLALAMIYTNIKWVDGEAEVV